MTDPRKVAQKLMGFPSSCILCRNWRLVEVRMDERSDKGFCKIFREETDVTHAENCPEYAPDEERIQRIVEEKQDYYRLMNRDEEDKSGI